MSRREFDGFERGLGDVITSLRAHLRSTSRRSRVPSTNRSG
jgi:hypothetical protein